MNILIILFALSCCVCCSHPIFKAPSNTKLNAKEKAALEARLAKTPEAQEAAVNIQKHARRQLTTARVDAVRAHQQQSMAGDGDGYDDGRGNSASGNGSGSGSTGSSRSRRPPAYTHHPPAKRFHGSNSPRQSQEGDDARGGQQLGVEADERRLSEVSEHALQLAGYQSKELGPGELRVPRYHKEEGRMLLEELALLNAKVVFVLLVIVVTASSHAFFELSYHSIPEASVSLTTSC
jgi:hypothetical protein